MAVKDFYIFCIVVAPRDFIWAYVKSLGAALPDLQKNCLSLLFSYEYIILRENSILNLQAAQAH